MISKQRVAEISGKHRRVRKKEYVSTLQRACLETILDAGATSNGDYEPDMNGVSTALNVAEQIVETVFLYNDESDAWRERVHHARSARIRKKKGPPRQP